MDILVLGHEFIKDIYSVYYICKNCKLIIFKTLNDRLFVSQVAIKQPGISPIELNLTCNEVIIKNIIE